MQRLGPFLVVFALACITAQGGGPTVRGGGPSFARVDADETWAAPPHGRASACLSQAIKITGVVLDARGEPVEGAEVTLSVESSIVARTKTNDDGRFAFVNVNTREGTLAVRAEGFETRSERWTAVEGEGTHLRFVLAPAPLNERLTVTATRTETRLGDAAASVVTLGAAELEATAALTLDDALRQVAGFQLFRRAGSRTANPTTQGVTLRGVGPSGASRALVLFDGVPLNDPFGGWVYWGRVPRAAVGRVEVLRGGASHLYGSGALGGVVQVFSRATTTEPALLLEASYGNQRTPDASLFAGGSRGRWRASLAAEIFHTEGYVLLDERERGPVDTPAGSRRSALDFKLERELGARARLSFRAAHFGESRRNGTPLQTNRTHARQFGAGLDWEPARFGKFEVDTYFVAQVYDQNFSAVSAARDSETLTRVQRVPSQAAGLSAQWSRAVGTRHTFVAGLDAREVRGASDETVYVSGRAASLVGAGGREKSFGLFFEDIYRAGPRLVLTGGLRLDRWRNHRAHSTTRQLSGAGVVEAFPDRSESSLSPHLSALFRPSGGVSLGASFYRAFRAPTLNELYRSFRVGDVLTLANENLRTEKLTGGEFGFGYSRAGNRLNLRATVFWNEVADPVANVTLTVTAALITRERRNLGRLRSRGLEFEAEARPTARLSISGGYLLLDSEVSSFPANPALEGLRVPQTARHQLNFQTRYDAAAGWTFGLQGRVQGSQFDDDQNRLPLGSFFTLDASAARRLGRRLELYAAAENLFNRRYEVGRTPTRTLGPPLLLRLGLRLRLGQR